MSLKDLLIRKFFLDSVPLSPPPHNLIHVLRIPQSPPPNLEAFAHAGPLL